MMKCRSPRIHSAAQQIAYIRYFVCWLSISHKVVNPNPGELWIYVYCNLFNMYLMHCFYCISSIVFRWCSRSPLLILKSLNPWFNYTILTWITPFLWLNYTILYSTFSGERQPCFRVILEKHHFPGILIILVKKLWKNSGKTSRILWKNFRDLVWI